MTAATFAGSDRDRFTDWLAARTGSDWPAATDHEFTRAIGDGTVADERFREYLVQDYEFVGGLCDLVGHAAGQAPTVDAPVRLAEFLVTLGSDETDYFERSIDALGPTLRPERRQRVARLFERAVSLERRFFDETPDGVD